MISWRSALRGLSEHPRYSLMRGVARFAAVRRGVVAARGFSQASHLVSYVADCEQRKGESLFPELDVDRFVRDLENNGIAMGLRLPQRLVDEIRAFSVQRPCYADRIPTRGFMLEARRQAELTLKKPILLAQYFNTVEQCAAIRQLTNDPVLRAVAARYLQSIPTFVGANLWWTFAVDALAEDRDRHAHLYHRDLDDFRFFKFFFYLTDVADGDGAHVCVTSSHKNPPKFRISDSWTIRRYSDSEVERGYPAEQITEIHGPAGIGFAENTLCVHRGLTPRCENRLLLQLQYALFDYGVMHDRRDRSALTLLD